MVSLASLLSFLELERRSGVVRIGPVTNGAIYLRDGGLVHLEVDAPEAVPACPAQPCREMWEREGTTPCLRVCPVEADGCLGGRLEAGRAVRTQYDASRCGTRVHTHWVGGFQKVLEETLNEPDRERRKMLVYGDFMTRTLWAITYSSTNIAQCFECMRVCPAAHGLKEMR